MVTVEVSGVGEVLTCRIDPSIVGDRELIEDLVPAAVNQALAKAKQLHAEAMKSMAVGLELPGLNEMLSQVTGEAPPGNPAQPSCRGIVMDVLLRGDRAAATGSRPAADAAWQR